MDVNFCNIHRNLHVRSSDKETLLLEGGVSKSENGTRWFENWGVGICVKGKA